MKRFYVEEDDNGKEIKRKLTTFANDDLTQLSDDELETLYYESSAQFLAKAMHFMKIENELFSRKNVIVSDEILINAGNNIIEAINQISNWTMKKEKALEQQRVSEENQRRAEAEKQAEVDRIAREHDEETERSNNRGSQHVSEKELLSEKEVKKIKYKEI